MKTPIISQFSGEDIEIAHDGHEQVVKIMRDAADKLTQRFEFLSLQQRRLSSLSYSDFLLELAIRLLKVCRPFSHQSLQRGSGLTLAFEIRACLKLASSRTLRG
jgi:hypothetical protein